MRKLCEIFREEIDPDWERFTRGVNEWHLGSGWVVFLNRYLAFDLQRREASMYPEVRRLGRRACELGLTQISLEIEPDLLVVQWYRDKPYDLCTEPPYWECQLPRAHRMRAAYVAEEIPAMLREFWPGTWSRTDGCLEARGLEFDADYVPGEPIWPVPPKR